MLNRREDFDSREQRSVERKKTRKRTMEAKINETKKFTVKLAKVQEEADERMRAQNAENNKTISSAVTELREVLTPRSIRVIRSMLSKIG